MKKIHLYCFVYFLFLPLLAQSQVKSKIWYDGNTRVMYNRDALEGVLKETDTVSTRSNGSGFTIVDLGLHFTPISDIEISSEIRLRNEFGGMWGNRSQVELRTLSAKGVVNNKIAFSVGDLYLKQTKFTLYNYDQEFSLYEPSVFKFYRDFINYENFYQSNHWRLQGFQSNFSYNMYNLIEQIDIDGFTARVRGLEWLGDPELLILGGSAVFRLNNKFNIGSHYINSFEVRSSANTTVAYHNPVLNIQLSYSGVSKGIPYKALLEGGFSKRGWDGDSLAPEIKGNFIKGSIYSESEKGIFNMEFRYVDTDFRSIGAQTRRVDYNNINTTYPYYSNNYTQRKVTMLDIMSDPNIYNQSLSTSLMNYNPMYSAVSPYGDATPNRVGLIAQIQKVDITDFFSAKLQSQYFSEVIGQGTTEKRRYNKSAVYSSIDLDRTLSLKNSVIIEGSMDVEMVKRGGNDFEKIDFSSILYSGSILIELIKDLKIVAGAKIFSVDGNEFVAERDIYDQINDYENKSYDSKETVLIGGLQYHFTDEIYFTMQYNQFNVLDNTNIQDEFNMGRLIFMFNMNL
ncbi:MAG: hypothetical protein CMD28_01735 [Flavobacteriales bacterium]|nr:hypothetical protein [Flavobacteriales bacterium]